MVKTCNFTTLINYIITINPYNLILYLFAEVFLAPADSTKENCSYVLNISLSNKISFSISAFCKAEVGI